MKKKKKKWIPPKRRFYTLVTGSGSTNSWWRIKQRYLSISVAPIWDVFSGVQHPVQAKKTQKKAV